jgi:hypothetical protein
MGSIETTKSGPPTGNNQDVPNAIFYDLAALFRAHHEIKGVTSNILQIGGSNFLYKFHSPRQVSTGITPDEMAKFTDIARAHLVLLRESGLDVVDTIYLNGGVDHDSKTAPGISTITKIIEETKTFKEIQDWDSFFDCYIDTITSLIKYMKTVFAQSGDRYILFDVFGKMNQFVYIDNKNTGRPAWILVDTDPRLLPLQSYDYVEYFLLDVKRKMFLNLDVVRDKLTNSPRHKQVASELNDLEAEIEKTIDLLFQTELSKT